MSTELVAIERINIKKDNGDADALRSCLAHYLQQFLDSASIESMTLHELTIRIDGESVLNVSDKTGGVGLSGLDKDWQRTETVHKAIEQIILDADVEVFLSYDMIHYFSNKNFYGSAFWTDMLQEFGCEAVRYHGLEYYDVESNVVMLYFDGKQLCDNPDYVPEEEVKDIDAWFCYTFDMELDAGDTFTVKQVDKMQETIASVRSVFGREKLIELAVNTAGTKLVVKYKTAEGEATTIASYRFRDLQDYQLIQQDGFYLRNGCLCLDPSSGMFITIDDALAFIPLDNVIGIKLPSGIVYP